MPTFHQRFAPIGEYTPLHITAAGTLVPVGGIVNTSSATAISPGTQSIVVASLANITPQMNLQFVNGVGAYEMVLVTAINTATSSITATFTQSHSGAYNIFSTKGTFLGPVVVGNPGTGCTLQLWNGHTAMNPAGQLIAAIPLVAGIAFYPFACRATQGLFYTLIVGSQAPDITIHFIDMAQ